MFLLKKIVAPLFFPTPFSLIVLFVGLFILWFTSRQRLGRILVTISALILAFCSYELTSGLLLRPLEQRYPPYDHDVAMTAPSGPPLFVAVLGGGHISDPDVPVTSQNDDASVIRVVEGIRIHRMIPGSKLILTGGAVFDPEPGAEVAARLAASLGVDRKDMVLELASKDTVDQARLIGDIVGDKPFVLVTSASHMPRSMGLARKRGLNPIPAATRHLVRRRGCGSTVLAFPSAENLYRSERAVYEYIGCIWSRLTRRM